MVEMTIGSRFYYKDKLCEVVEGDCNQDCVFFDNHKKCEKANCFWSIRHDDKDVCFKEVKENDKN